MKRIEAIKCSGSMVCLGCVPIVLLWCKGYTADARLRHSRFKAVGLDGFEAKVTQTLMEVIPLAYP